MSARFKTGLCSGMLWAVGLFAGGCATSHGARTLDYVAEAPAPVQQQPVYVVMQPAPERVVLPAPPPPGAVQVAGAPAAMAPFQPRDAPMLAYYDKRPHGQKPAPMDPLLKRRSGHWTVPAPSYGYYTPYYGYGGPYYGYYGPGYGYYGPGYGYYGPGRAAVGFGIGIGIGAAYSHGGHGHGHHGHGGHPVHVTQHRHGHR